MNFDQFQGLDHKNYKLFRHDRVKGKGGGLGIYVCDDLICHDTSVRELNISDKNIVVHYTNI